MYLPYPWHFATLRKIHSHFHFDALTVRKYTFTSTFFFSFGIHFFCSASGEVHVHFNFFHFCQWRSTLSCFFYFASGKVHIHFHQHKKWAINGAGLGVQSINGTKGIFSLWKKFPRNELWNRLTHGPVTTQYILLLVVSCWGLFSQVFFSKAIWSLVVLPDTDHWDAVEVEPSPFMKLKMVWNQFRWLFQPVAHCGRGQTWNIWTSQLSGGWIWILEPLKWK